FLDSRVEVLRERVSFFCCLRAALCFTHGCLVNTRSHFYAGQLAGLLHPGGEFGFVELVVLVDVEVANVFLLGMARRESTQRRAAEESHFDVFRQAMETEEPGGLSVWTLDAVEGR